MAVWWGGFFCLEGSRGEPQPTGGWVVRNESAPYTCLTNHASLLRLEFGIVRNSEPWHPVARADGILRFFGFMDSIPTTYELFQG